MEKYNVAIIGATGSVGKETISILHERKFPIQNIYAIASLESIGKTVSYGDREVHISKLDDIHFEDIDIIFSSAGSRTTKLFIDKAINAECFIIDKTSLFRMDPEVPLIVPEVNEKEILNCKKNIIANPNCCVIPLVVALNPLNNAAKIKRIVVSTYQSVSGQGKAAMDELYNHTKAKFVFQNLEHKVFEAEIAFNLIPKIDKLFENGYTAEETKICEETKKILGSAINITVTSVRVPVFIGHSMSINVEFESELLEEDVKEILKEADSIVVSDNIVTPQDVVGLDDVFVSRVRKDFSQKNTINMWVTCDNLRKGAALNGVQIAEKVIYDTRFIKR